MINDGECGDDGWFFYFFLEVSILAVVTLWQDLPGFSGTSVFLQQMFAIHFYLYENVSKNDQKCQKIGFFKVKNNIDLIRAIPFLTVEAFLENYEA